MTTQELKNKIEKVLGNNIRCLLPSYWWKNLFHSVADRIDEVEQKIDEVEQKIDDVEIPDGIPIVNSEDALNRLDLPKGSVATVISDKKEEIDIRTCHLAENADLLLKEFDMFTRIYDIEQIGSISLSGIYPGIYLYERPIGSSYSAISIDFDKGGVINYVLHNSGTSRIITLEKLNQLLKGSDYRFVDIDYGTDGSGQSAEKEELFDIIESFLKFYTGEDLSGAYFKSHNWEKLARVDELKEVSNSIPKGTIVFYKHSELPEEYNQLNIEAYNKVRNLIVSGKLDFDVKIYYEGRIVNPTFISGTMDILLFTAESEGYRYVFQCLESGSVTVETKPISGGGDTPANNEVSIITFKMPVEGEVLTEDAKKQNAESYAKIVDAFNERKAYDVKIDLAGLAFNDVDTIWLPSIYQGELVMSFDLSNKSTSTKMLLIVTSDGSVDSTEISSGGTSGDITIDTEMSSTSTNPVQNKVVYSELQKKQDTISDLADIRSGAAKGETAIQKVKTINGESIEGEGNIVIKGGEGGLKYVEERTVYPSKMMLDGEETDSYEISETERAYNIETLDKARNERSVIIVAAGLIFQFVSGKSNSTERIAKFSSVGDLDNDLLSVSITINQDGDAILEQKVLELGGGGETDTSNLATKEELNNLTNEVIANEEVHAAALNDLNERKADKEYVENALKNIDTSGLATKEEVQNLTNEIITNEEVHAAALVDLDARIRDIVARLNNAGL